MSEKSTYEELEKVEKVFREIKGRYDSLFERSLDFIYLHDLEGNFIDANPAALKLLGYTKSDILDLNFASLLSQDQIPMALKALEELKEKGFQEDSTEFKLKRKDGEYVYVETRATLISRDEKPYAIQGIARDMSERKRAEEALRQSEEKYRNLFSTAQVGLARTRISDGKVLECNQKMAEIFGFKRVEDFNNEWVFSDNYVDPHLRERMLKEIKKTGILNNAEAEFYAKDKSRVWARFDTRIFSEEGYMDDVVVDITEQKIAEAELQESEKRIRNLVEGSIQGILIHRNHKPLFVNQKWASIHGYSPEEVLRMDSVVQLISSKDQKRMIGYKKARLRGEDVPTDYEYQGVHRNGSFIWLDNRVSVVQWGGGGRLFKQRFLTSPAVKRLRKSVKN